MADLSPCLSDEHNAWYKRRGQVSAARNSRKSLPRAATTFEPAPHDLPSKAATCRTLPHVCALCAFPRATPPAAMRPNCVDCDRNTTLQYSGSASTRCDIMATAR